ARFNKRADLFESERAKSGEVPADNQFLDLSSAVGNRQNSRLSEQALGWIFFRNPVGAVNLYPNRRDFYRYFGSVRFRHRGLRIAADALIDKCQPAQREEARGV